MPQTEIHEMKGNQFPFGLLNIQADAMSRVPIKKRYKYKNEVQYSKLTQKIEKLKTISHKHTINLRCVQDTSSSSIDLFYPYISIPLQNAFGQDPEPSVKDLHKQFISLAIYLAKNYILTSFNPNRCGVVFNQGKYIIKYYLPLNEIIITDNLSMLERSVQLFNLQSMHYLDTLCQSVLNSSRDLSARSSFIKSKNKLSPREKNRKQSQPVGEFKSPRKFSTYPSNQQIRKLSSLSKQLSQFSEMRNKRMTKESTRVSGSSFSTLKNLITQRSQKRLETKSIVYQNMEQKIIALKERSTNALKTFFDLRIRIEEYRSLSLLIQKISY